MENVLITFFTAMATGFASWIFARRKNKAEAVGAEKNNDRTEIDNYKLIAQEWREAAERWKDLADEYQKKLIANSRQIEELVTSSITFKKEIRTLKTLLAKANKRIAELEKHDPSHV